MKHSIIILLAICLPLLMTAQINDEDGSGLVIHSISMDSPDATHIDVTISNSSPKDFYAYPELVILDRNNDTIAISKEGRYGITNSIDTYQLTRIKDVEFPFKGNLHVCTNFMSNTACSIPISFDKGDRTPQPQNKYKTSAAFTVDQKQIIIDLGLLPKGLAVSVSNLNGEEVFYTPSTEKTFLKIPAAALEKGNYYVWIWDKNNKLSKKLRITHILKKG